MARVQINETVFQPVTDDDLLLRAVTGASVQVNIREGGAATVYADATGPAELDNPQSTEWGIIEGWVDEGVSYDLVITSDGETVTRGFEAYSGPGAVGPEGPPGDAANTELGRAEISDPSYFITTTMTGGIVANSVNAGVGWTKTVTVGDRPVVIWVFCPSISTTIAGIVNVYLYRDGVQVQAALMQQLANVRLPVSLRFRDNPAAGEHTYEVKLNQSNAGALVSIGAHLTLPAQMQIVTV
jgi:hypothetical protein